MERTSFRTTLFQGRSRWKDLAERIKISSKNINGIEKNEAAGNPYLQVFNTFFVESHEVDAREATYLILEKLHEMGRDDACDIILNSMGERLVWNVDRDDAYDMVMPMIW